MNFTDNEEQPGQLYSRMVRKNLDEVTLEDVANLDLISICCDEPLRQVPDTSRLNTILDITSFKPFKPLSRREERAAKAKETPPKPAPTRRLPFNRRSNIRKGETQSLQTHSVEDLEKDYYKSLMDINGKFQKYVPKMVCQGDTLMVEFRMQMADGKIWRTFQMDASTNFYLLRRALLDLIGWKEEMSWSFMYVSRENKVCMIGQTGPLKTDAEIRNEEQLVIIETLNENYCRFCFIYDLKLRWRIDVMLAKVLDRPAGVLLPVCVRGKGVLNFAGVASPAKLEKVCKSLKEPEDPKRAKYISKYGDLLAPVVVATTPFPSFYSPEQAAQVPPVPKKKRKPAAEGPIIVTIDVDAATGPTVVKVE